MRNTRMLSILLCLLCMGAILLGGCESKQEDTKKDDVTASTQQEDTTQPVKELIVFYDDCQNLLDNFALCYPEISIEAHSMSAQDVGDEGIEGLIRKVGEPDLVLSRGDESIEALIELGVIDSMDDLYGNDATIEHENYFPGTFTVGRIEDVLYALPVSVNMYYMTIRESEWNQSDFTALPDEYTLSDLLTVMEAELDKEKEPGYLNFYKEAVRPIEMLVDAGVVQIENGTVEMDQDIFQQMMRVLCKQRMNENALVENGYTWQEYPAINPTAYDGQFLAASWGSGSGTISAPQVGLVYAQSANQEYHGEGIKVVWRPSQIAGEYGACVQTMGMIGKNSARRSEAYDALRKMMDMTLQSWSIPVGGPFTSVTYCPVNIECAKALLNCVEETGEESVWVSATNQNSSNGFLALKQQLTEELREDLFNYIDSISFLYRMDPNLYTEIVNDIMLLAIYDRTEQMIVSDDYSDCYTQVLNELQNNMSGDQS